MGYDRGLNQVNIIQDALSNYQGFTSGEKKYCVENLVDWISRDKTLNLLIEKFEEKSLDMKPFLKKLDLLA